MNLIVYFALALNAHGGAQLLNIEGSDLRGTAAGIKKPTCINCTRPHDGIEAQARRVRRAAARSNCDLNQVQEFARQIGGRSVHSGHKCLPAARRAYEMAGCRIPAGFRHNARVAFANLRKNSPWRCRAGENGDTAPHGATVFSEGCGSTHTEVKSYAIVNGERRTCYYSDFHHPQCKPSTRYNTCRYNPIGWCVP